MTKTLIITDSATDISFEAERALGVRVLNIPIAIDGKPLRDRVDIVGAAFIDALAHAAYRELPKTSQITAFEYYEAYVDAVKAGCSDVIVVCINGKGSGCLSAAGHAVEMLAAENPDEAARLRVHRVDGGSYTLAVSWPLPLAVQKLAAGTPAEAVADWLRDLYDRQLTLVGLTQLKYPRLSGRLSSSAAVVGDALGIKPVLSIYQGENTVMDKCRGDKALVPKLTELYLREAADPAGDYVLAYGSDKALGDELAEAVTRAAGRPPVAMAQAGPLIALNAGPRIIGLAFRRKDA